MNDLRTQYATGLSRQRIERALITAGKDPGRLQPADLGTLEDFHTMGRIATSRSPSWPASPATTTCSTRQRDRRDRPFPGRQYGCRVTAIDLTEEYCATARWLNQLTGLDGLITVRPGGHHRPAVRRRHLPGGHQPARADERGRQDPAVRRGPPGAHPRRAARHLGHHRRHPGELGYPLPWADQPELSHLVSPGQLRAAIESAGFTIEHWNDLTGPAAKLMTAVLSRPAGPLGLHAFVENFAVKAANLTQALSAGRLRVIQGVALATG